MNPSKDGDSTTTLESRVQCLTPLPIKIFFLISTLNWGDTKSSLRFLTPLSSLHRLLAPGYTETHYAADGQPVTVTPNHTVGAG